MVANQATPESNPCDRALDLASRMEAMASDKEWDRVEQLAQRLRNAILEIPEEQRATSVFAVNRHFERVQTMALVARSELKDKLSGIRRGRVATRAYGEPKPEVSNATLR